jgi:transcriptional regulator with XRE-family HTH domain
VVIDLARIRMAAGVTQVQLAERLGVGQAQISKTEHRADVRLSTLVAYLNALGAHAQVTVTLPGGEIIHQVLTNPRKEGR